MTLSQDFENKTKSKHHGFYHTQMHVTLTSLASDACSLRNPGFQILMINQYRSSQDVKRRGIEGHHTNAIDGDKSKTFSRDYVTNVKFLKLSQYKASN